MENLNLNITNQIIAVAKRYTEGYDFDGDLVQNEEGENIMISYANIDEVYRRFLETDSVVGCGIVVAELEHVATLASEEFSRVFNAFVKLEGAKLAAKLGFVGAAIDIAFLEYKFEGLLASAVKSAEAKAAYLRKTDNRKGRRISYDDFETIIWKTRCLGRDYDLMSDFEKKIFDKVLEESEVTDNFSKTAAAEAEEDLKNEIEEDLRRMEQDFWAD